MSNDPKPDDTSATPDEVDDGLAFAYGEDSGDSTSPSVIARIGEITGSKPKVLLRDDRAGDTPMLKPLGPDDTQQAGKYTVQGELGRGGVGTVHRGHDQDLGRDVAMKFLHEKYKDEPTILQRFVEEAQIGGQLQHPGIVPVYDLGMVDGKPFFAMKLVKGQTLAKKLAERESPAADRRTFLAIFEDVCQTLAYAHVRGVVHRDLKPANIMIGSFGEVQVVDWGMGKVLQTGGVADEKLAAERQAEVSVIETVRSDGHGTQSVMGSVMGTPAYMPPEQARGDVERMDERSDVFALGAILCEILTGLPPYVGEPDELIAMAAMAKLDDAQARLEACGGEPEMVELATRCLMPAPAARPKSAEVVAHAVHDHLAAVESRVHEARVEAAEAKVRATALKRTQTLGISLTAVIAAGLVVSLWFWHAADTAATNEGIARAEAVASATEAHENEQLAVKQTEVAKRELARAVEIKTLITEMLGSITPEQAKGADVTLLRGILDTASKRLTEDAIEDDLVAAELHALTGRVYLSIGLHPEAERHLPVAFELRKHALGDEHPDTLSAMGMLAILYRDQGRLDDAETLQLQILEIMKRVLGEEHSSTLDGMAVLAGLYRVLGRFAEAETLGLKTLEVRKRVLGEEHPRTLLCMGSLAMLYQTQGRFAEAEKLYLQVLEVQKRVPSEEDTATFTASLANLYLRLGRLAEAEPLLLQVLKTKKRVLDEEHPSTLTSMNHLANVYAMQGRYREAEPLFLQVLEGQKRVLGEKHPNTLINMGGLANLYTAQGRYKEAEPLLLRSLELCQSELGEEHPQTLRGMVSLVRVYWRQGRYREAAQLARQTLELSKRVLGEEHPETVSNMGNLASLYVKLGRYKEAEPLSLQTLEIQERVLGKEHPERLAGMGNLAILYQNQGRYREAEPLMLQTLETKKRVLGAEHPDTLLSMCNVASLYEAQDRYSEAEALTLETIEIQKRVLGEEHPNTLGMLANIGHLYDSMERFDAAAEMFEGSLPILRRVLGPEHPYTCSAMAGLATAYQKLGRTKAAVALQRELIALKIAAAEADGASAIVLDAAAETLLESVVESLRDPARALGFAKRACALEKDNWKLLDSLARAQHQTGDSFAAIETQKRVMALMPEGADPEMAERLAEYEAAVKDR